MFAYGKFGPLVGAIDEGTSSTRFVIYLANSSEVVAMCQKEFEEKFYENGCLKEDPIEILDAVTTCIAGALKQLVLIGGSPKDIVGIGVTNQRETTIVWDKITGKPLHKALLWLDNRTSTTVTKLLDIVPNNTRNKNYLKPLCGLPLLPYFSGVKFRWLSDNVYAVKEAIKKGTCYFGTLDTWLIWNLTGGVNGGKHVTDVTNASRSMLMNIDNLKWDPFLMKFFDIPQSVLPEIKSSSEIYGYISNGPLTGIPISGCLGDQQAALVGQMCLKKSQALVNYGTGCYVLRNVGHINVTSTKGLLTTVAYQLGSDSLPCYALEGSAAIAGPALGWPRYNFVPPPALTEQDSENIVFIPSCNGLYVPHSTQITRKNVYGVTDYTTSSDILEAALETICFQVKDILDAMNEAYGVPLEILKVCGGMSSSELVMQMQADVLGIDVLKTELTGSSAFGAAMVAFWAVDKVRPRTGIAISEGMNIIYGPKMSKYDRDMRYQEWKKAIVKSLGEEED